MITLLSGKCFNKNGVSSMFKNFAVLGFGGYWFFSYIWYILYLNLDSRIIKLTFRGPWRDK